MRASQYLNAEDRARVAQAVRDAEQTTAGEIVPVLATESGHYDRPEDAAGLLFALAVLAVAWCSLQEVAPSEWSHTPEPVLGLLHVIALLLAGFVAGVLITRRIPALRRLFTPRSMMQDNVEAAAARVFHERKLRNTRAATGILIYVSLFERTVRVLGDEAISAKLAQADWDAVCDIILGGFRTGRAADGFCEGISRCGNLLATHFPRPADDTNEFADDLVILD